MRRWTDIDKELLKKLWNRGNSLKSITTETGRSRSAILTMKRKMGLKPRRRPKSIKTVALKIWLDEDMDKAMKRAAFDLRTSNAEYIRALIRRDTGIGEI